MLTCLLLRGRLLGIQVEGEVVGGAGCRVQGVSLPRLLQVVLWEYQSQPHISLMQVACLTAMLCKQLLSYEVHSTSNIPVGNTGICSSGLRCMCDCPDHQGHTATHLQQLEGPFILKLQQHNENR